MSLPVLKENATLEEKNQWIIDTQEEYKRLENEKSNIDKTLTDKQKREKELEERNQELFLRITRKKETGTETTEDDEDIKIMKEHIGEDVYNCLNKRDIENLKIIMNGDDE